MAKTTFAGKTALITGGSSGIGLALAIELAQRGANLWLLARDQTKLDNACQQVGRAVQNPEQQVRAIQADVADLGTLTAALQPILDQAGVPDLLFNSAGISHPGFFLELDMDVHRKNMEVNYFGTLHTIHLIAPGMVKRGSGHIINISSIAGYHGILGYSTYSPSKFAVRGLSDVLLYELKPYGVTVSVVFPPDTDTPQLASENKIKPPLLKVLSESNNKVLPAAQVAHSIMNAVQRGQYLILPGSDSFLLYLVNSLPLHTPYRIMDMMIADARRKLSKHNPGH